MPDCKPTMWIRCFLSIIIALICPSIANSKTILDLLNLGQPESEKYHSLVDQHSEVIVGGLGESARRLLPPANNGWEGGSIKFTVRIDSASQNYLTAKFWGSDAPKGMLVLFCEGKQVGYRHLGDIEFLDYGIGEPAFGGRFYYSTLPLPLSQTKGRNTVELEIRSYGPIWGYGDNFERFQKPMVEPSRGIYNIYTHADGSFVPPATEKQGGIPQVKIAKSPGIEVLDKIKERVNRELDTRINSAASCSQMQLQLLARAYDVEWTHAYKNPKAIEQIIRGLDSLFQKYRKDPKLAATEPSTWNPDWFGLGVCGEVIALRKVELEKSFDAPIDDGAGKQIIRRDAYTEMLIACREWHRRNRRLYTNQTMINDLNGIYNANRGVLVLSPQQAMTETEARRYLYESVGLEPWRDSDSGAGAAPETGRTNWGVGPNYWQLTDKGLTRELGYVGSYGEVIDLVCEIYDATRPSLEQAGDEKIKAQLTKIARARCNFRYPSVDSEGNQVMRLEQIIGWRDAHYPGYIAYAQRATRDAGALHVAAITGDPLLVGASQQMIADNQFFASEVEAMNDGAQPLRTTIGRLFVPGEYQHITSQKKESMRLPMTPGQPDFVFSDEQDGVVAIKHGTDVFYASLFWRARHGVNSLAKVHYTTPNVDQIATVYEDVEFTPSGQFYTRPNWINFGFGNGGPKFPTQIDSAMASEKLPIAKIPSGIDFKPGDENVYAGRADFYTLRYRDYVIAMNTTTDKHFVLKPIAGISEVIDLISGKTLKFDSPIIVPPRTTIVFKSATSLN